jgi:hypothetical protein
MNEREENAIRLRAYQLWLDAGRPDDKHEEHWYQAIDEFNLKRELETVADGIPPEDDVSWSQTPGRGRIM